ncbi:hypothetical protein [Bradyrhizobium sp. 62]|uniref:hypothetical protein n=1 Tax=Bradyrhizobium sp. 62 TaxID=1043588 RepID=UPI001FF715E9|nr:hypothetical protein [Bradyrhizobium sp. 62]MCK1369422.1 hypothetical protein [Bradyrhizobium sp. 62]
MAVESENVSSRHCERSEAIQLFPRHGFWIASLRSPQAWIASLRSQCETGGSSPAMRLAEITLQ